MWNVYELNLVFFSIVYCAEQNSSVRLPRVGAFPLHSCASICWLGCSVAGRRHPVTWRLNWRSYCCCWARLLALPPPSKWVGLKSWLPPWGNCATASVFPSFTRAHKKTLFAQTTTLFACYLHTTTITSKNNMFFKILATTNYSCKFPFVMRFANNLVKSGSVLALLSWIDIVLQYSISFVFSSSITYLCY